MKQKSKIITLVLAIFLGLFGVHDYYVGKWKSGLAHGILFLSVFLFHSEYYLVIASLIIAGWYYLDLHRIITNSYTDKKGQPLAPIRKESVPVRVIESVPQPLQNVPEEQQNIPQNMPLERSTVPEVHAYSGTEPFIFVSYAHRDSDRVLPVIAKLQADGFPVWFDEGIDPGTEWDDNIAAHVRQCGLMLALLSSSYLNSNNCKDELNFARDLDKKRILIYLENVTLPDGMAMRLNRLQAIHQYRYQNQNDFYQKLYDSPDIQAIRAGTGK